MDQDRATSLATRGVQQSLGDLGTPLAEVTFVVVDLETTGGRPDATGITEIGAVKVRGGEVLGEFATLVDPGSAIPPAIERLTGITTSMVTSAPRIASVLPAFLEFAGADTVFVAHNAGFDIGFLKAACAGCGIDWPRPKVVDTVVLARALVPRDEAPNHRLGTLAALFGATTTPNHRALADARATVEVFHALLGRLGSLGVVGLEDLLTFSGRVPAARRRKATLVDALPEEPGVYIFKNSSGDALYVGTSSNIRRRVKTYFTAGEQRRRMGEMVDQAASVTPIPCATSLEAAVREVRLIASLKPPYNRRSKNPERTAWLKVTSETFPRLSVVRETRPDDALYLGPFRSTGAARDAREVVHTVRRIRQCTQPIGERTRKPACALADLGRCDAPCMGAITPDAYANLVSQLRLELTDETHLLIDDVTARLRKLGAEERFEEARALRDAMLELVRTMDRYQRRSPVAANPELIAARPHPMGGWDFALVRHGRLAGSAHAERGQNTRPVIESLKSFGENVTAPPGVAGAALTEETDLVLRWLERPGTRVVETHLPWQSPRLGAGRLLRRLEPTVLRAREASPSS